MYNVLSQEREWSEGDKAREILNEREKMMGREGRESERERERGRGS